MSWLSKLFGRQSKPADVAPAVGGSFAPPPGGTAPPQPLAPIADVEGDSASPVPSLLCWLFETPPPQSQLLPAERDAIDVVDRVLQQETLPPELLPRSANVVPRLIALLRQDDATVQALVERISQDPALVVEVIRQASTARFAQQGPAPDLPQAIQRLGLQGLEMAIARVLLRPLFQSQSGSLVAMTAPKLWLHAETMARHGAVQATQAGAGHFDGYLAGLLHDIGWTVCLHALQRGGVTHLSEFSDEGIAALSQRAHRLFGRAASAWQITPAFTAFVADASHVPLSDSTNLLTRSLLAASAPCMAELLNPQGADGPA